MTLNPSTVFAIWIALILAIAPATGSLWLPLVLAPPLTLCLVILADFLLTKEPTFGFLLALKKYAQWRKYYIQGFFIMRELRTASKDLKKCQDAELKKLLQLNSDTEYHKTWHLDQVETRDDYVRIQPLVKYTHFESFFERMIRGEEKVMTSQSPMYYAITSGTTGRPSKIPWIKYQLDNVNRLRALQAYNAGNIIHGVRNLSRSMKLYYNVQRLLEKSANGTPIGPASASDVFNLGDVFTTPSAGYDIVDEPSARYVHLLFGLRHRSLKKIEAVFVSVVYFAFLDMEKYWKDLVKDIRDGTLKKDLSIPEPLRIELLKKLKPDRRRAEELEAEFSKGFINIAKRVWPNLEYIDSIGSGPFSHYADALRTQFIGDILIFSWMYGASEGLFGLNLWPSRLPENFIVWPWQTYYEFIPLEHVGEAVPKTLFIDQLEIGGEYEVVLTTASGLYRYRLGDVIRVADFFNKCPVIQFLYRSGQLLSLKGEKVSEIVMLNTLKEVVDSVDGKAENIVDFTCCESVALDALDLDDAPETSGTPYYVIFLEVRLTPSTDAATLQKGIVDKLDLRLIENHARYAYYRKKDSISHLRFYLLKPGSFIRLRSFMLDTSTTSPAQLKLPRVLRKPQLVEFMWHQRMF